MHSDGGNNIADRNEWNLFINQTEDYIEYGLIKTLNSIKEKSLKEFLRINWSSLNLWD